LINYTPGSEIKLWWKCEYGHEWDASINHRTNGDGCPMCKNKTEKKFYDYIKILYNKIICQFKPEWSRNPKTNYYLTFDFCLEEFKLIIEIDGRQHFIQVSNWETPKETQSRDKLKINMALSNGYSIIRILQKDISIDKYNWKDEIKTVIKKYDTPQVIYLCKNDEYKDYKKFMENDIVEEIKNDIVENNSIEEPKNYKTTAELLAGFGINYNPEAFKLQIISGFFKPISARFLLNFFI